MSGAARLALLGDPVGHSLSPRFQGAALAAAGIAGGYEAIATPAAELEGRLAELAARGYLGLNLTVPLKERAFDLLAADADMDPTATALRAVNTLRRDGDAGLWRAVNTDVAGCARAARELAGDPRGASVVLLGAGGAARAALLALCREGAARIAVWNRTAVRRDRALGDLAPHAGRTELIPLELADGEPAPACDLIIQATPLGIAPDDPLPPLPAPGTGRALDLITHATGWQRACGRLCGGVADGRGMLLWQGAAAFEFWFDRPAPVAAMRRALRLP